MEWIKRFINRIECIVDTPYKSGQVIHGRYQVIDLLGIGSYGTTYVAEDRYLKQTVVIKKIRTLKTKKRRISFQRECEILQSLRHPRIPTLLESFKIKGAPHLVIEYIPGKTVEHLLFQEQTTFTERASFSLIKEILLIVEYIHKQGIVHRDLRIPNVIISNGEAYVIDFGLARRLNERDDSPPFNNHFLVEKRLRRQIDVRSDIYALGHFLLYLLYSTYTPVYEQERSWEEELSLSPKARTVIRKMLQIDVPYKNVRELQLDIDELLITDEIGGEKNVIL